MAPGRGKGEGRRSKAEGRRSKSEGRNPKAEVANEDEIRKAEEWLRAAEAIRLPVGKVLSLGKLFRGAIYARIVCFREFRGCCRFVAMRGERRDSAEDLGPRPRCRSVLFS